MGAVTEALTGPYKQLAKDGPYARLYAAFKKNWKNTTRAPRYTPEDCARAIRHAIETPEPKPRYTVTRNAAVLSWARRVLTDSYLDKRTARAFGVEA